MAGLYDTMKVQQTATIPVVQAQPNQIISGVVSAKPNATIVPPKFVGPVKTPVATSMPAVQKPQASSLQPATGLYVSPKQNDIASILQPSSNPQTPSTGGLYQQMKTQQASLPVTGVNGTPTPRPVPTMGQVNGQTVAGTTLTSDPARLAQRGSLDVKPEITPAQGEANRIDFISQSSTGDLLKKQYGDNPVTKAAAFLFTPLDPLTRDISDIKEANDIKDQVASGKIDQSVYDGLDVLHKSGLQIVGDVAQAVITADTLGLASGAVIDSATGQVLKRSLSELAVEGAKQGGFAGAQFGVATALSSGSTDPDTITKIITENIVGGALIGTVLHTALPALVKVVAATNEIKNQAIQSLVDKGYTPEEARNLVLQGGYIGGIPEKGSTNINELSTPETTPESTTKEEAVQPQILSPLEQKAASSYGDSIIPDSKFYNVDRLNTTPEGKAVVNEALDQAGAKIQETVGKTLTHAEVIKRAQQTSVILNDTIGRDQTADMEAATLNLRNKIVDISNGGKVTPELIDLINKDKAMGANIARQLEARKINANPGQLTNLQIVLNALKEKGKLTDDILKQASDEKVDFNDPKQATDFFRKVSPTKISDWIDLLRYNSMLSSPKTSIIKMTADIGSSGTVRPLTLAIQGLQDAAKAALTGSEREHFVGESGSYIKGYFSSLKEAWNNITSDVNTLKDTAIDPDTAKMPLATSKGGKAVEAFLKAPSTLLNKIETFFKTLAKGGEEAAMKTRLAEGGKQNEMFATPEDEVNANVQKSFFRGGHDPREGYVLQTIQGMSDAIGTMRNSKNPVLSTIAKWTFPFLNIGTQLTKGGIEYSPLGITTLWGAENKAEQLAKFTIGLGATTLAAGLVGSDKITGPTPTSPTLKAAFQDSGRQPWSVRIGNKWVSYQRLPVALAFNLAFVAAVKQAVDDERLTGNKDQAIAQAFATSAQFVTEASYFRNLGEFVDATKGNVSGFTNFLANYPQQLIPLRALMSWTNNIIDPVSRQADPNQGFIVKQMQSVMMQIPGLSQKVPAQLNSQGQPIKKQNSLLNNFSPAPITSVDQPKEKAYQEQQKLGVINSQVSKESAANSAKAQQLYSKILPMTPQQRAAYLKANKPSAKVMTELTKQIQTHVNKLDSFQQAFNNAPAETRGKYLYQSMKGMTTRERAELFQYLQKGGSITPQVLQDLGQEISVNGKP
jgi:hypothetical protein